MYIWFHVKADNLKEAKIIVQDSLDEINDIIVYEKRKSVKPYWKIDGIYVVEFIIKLSKGTLQHFLRNYSDIWLKCGEPINGYELLATVAIEDSKYIKDRFTFINIDLEEEDIVNEFVVNESGKECEYTIGRETFINVF